MKSITDLELLKECVVAILELMFPVTRWHIDASSLSGFTAEDLMMSQEVLKST
jgi:hypothetical protein